MRLQHGRVALELYEFTRNHDGGTPLLLLHELFGSSANWGEAAATWPGPVFALDFAGHGRSEWVVGGGYYAELSAADADVALAHLGRAALVGAGLGAYVALLLAGARPDAVPAALLLPGRGLSGGGALPNFDGPRVPFDVPTADEPPGAHDPLVRILDRDVRPEEYAGWFAAAARRLLLVNDGAPRPPWWDAIRRCPSAESVPADLRLALTQLAARVG